MGDLREHETSLSLVLKDLALVAVGAVSYAVDMVERALHGEQAHAGQDAPPSAALDPVFGGAALAVRLTGRGAGLAVRSVRLASRPVAALMPSGLRTALDSAFTMADVTELGRYERRLAERDASVLARRAIATMLPLVLDQLDLTHEVMERVDLNAVIKSVDLDAAVGLVDFAAVIDKVPIELVLERLDLDAIVARVDLNRAIGLVDLDAVAAKIDIDAILDRVDLVGLAGDIIAALDLPEIVRSSSGSMATDMVHDARVQSMEADAAVSRIVDRLLLRRRGRASLPPPRGPEDAPVLPGTTDAPAAAPAAGQDS